MSNDYSASNTTLGIEPYSPISFFGSLGTVGALMALAIAPAAANDSTDSIPNDIASTQWQQIFEHYTAPYTIESKKPAEEILTKFVSKLINDNAETPAEFAAFAHDNLFDLV